MRRAPLNRSFIISLVALGSVASAPAVEAGNWPQWRGPNGNGISDESGVPVEWSGDKNIRWKKLLPGWGASTPVVWGDHIFLTSQDDGDDLWTICVDRRSGKVAWKQVTGNGSVRTHQLNNSASASAVTDGQHVWTFFATGDMACYDFNGKRVWHRDLQKDYGAFQIGFGMANSPVLYGDALIMSCFNRGKAYVVGLNKTTGKQMWRADPKPGEGRGADSYSTPVIYEHNGSAQVLVSGAGRLEAFSPTDGKSLWQCRGLTGRIVGTPVVGGQFIVTNSAKRGPIVAIQPGGSGDVTDSHTRWTVTKQTPDVPSLAVHEGLVYWVTDRGIANCVDEKTGETVWSERLDGTFWTSPVIAEGRLYLLRDSGETIILKTGRKFEKIATNALGDGECVASPAVAGGEIFLRTHKRLYCVSNTAGGGAGDPAPAGKSEDQPASKPGAP